MAFRRRLAKRKPSALRRRQRVVPVMRGGRLLSYRPHQPVFTETFRHSIVTLNAGFASTVLGATVDSIPQLSQYSNLYQRYRILKTTWMILPQITSYDVSTTTFSSNYQLCPRVCYAINDTAPNVSTGPVPPTSEQVLLQDNGCKIRQGNRLIRFSNRPQPQTIDAQNVVTNLRGKFISFAAGPNTTHWGVAMTFSNAGVFNPPATVDPSYVIYCKLTFQVADPR